MNTDPQKICAECSAFVKITATGLKKRDADVPSVLQEFLVEHGVHNFLNHKPGEKAFVEAQSEDGNSFLVVFRRPKAKGGVFRRISINTEIIRLLNLKEGSVIKFSVNDGRLILSARQLEDEERDQSLPSNLADLVLRDEGSECLPRMNATIGALTEYGYGGKSAAVVPGQKTKAEKVLPLGDLPPGALAGKDFLKKALRGEADKPRWLFLIGGPGNGKSWISRGIEEEHDLLKSDTGADELARRDYHYEIGDSQFVILNDATITLEDGESRDLLEDLNKHANTGTNLTANLNRGAIIEDLHKNGGGEEWARSLLYWLLEKESHSKSLEQYSVDFPMPDGGFEGSIQGKTLSVYGREIEIVAVFLDKHSLLETGSKLQPFESKGVSKRLKTSVGKVALELIQEHRFEADGCSDCSANATCPFFANAKSLRVAGGKMAGGMCDIFRAAEIASGSPFTYREIWSLLSQAILGRWIPEWRDQHPCSWVKAGPSIEELHRQRIHRSLFPRWEEWIDSGEDDIPMQDNIDAIDPGLDSSASWANLARRAVQSRRYGNKPYQFAVDDKEDESRLVDGEFRDVISRLDLEVDRERFGFKDESKHPVDEAARIPQVRKSGLELVRLLGLWNGRPACRPVFNQWIKAHNLEDGIRLRDARRDKNFPLAKGLLKLVLPPTEILEQGQTSRASDSGECLLPVFEPRTEPLIFPRNESVICLTAEPIDITMKLESRGDRLLLILQQTEEGLKNNAELDLDFWTCREALVLVDEPGGFTEKGFGSAPRLERFRASICASLEAKSPMITIADNRRYGISFDIPVGE
ncbi:hypothetical protein OAE82_00945 [bacterium]|nr:hypothetical protein [bacterium]